MRASRRRRIGGALFLLASLFPALPVRAAEATVSRRLKILSESLTADYKRKDPPAAKEPLAVLSFSTSEKLAKTKAGFAVSELLTHFFVQSGAYTVVERNLVNQLEDEQKFQLMAADTATAVKIGKMTGAKLLVLGSLEKAGNAYHANARLVRVETGEIVSTAFQEFPAAAFEEEAKPYLNLVPEKQAIGFYAAYLWLPTAKAGESYTHTIPPVQYDVTPLDFDLPMFGGGLRFFPSAHLLLDLSAFVPVNKPAVTHGVITVLPQQFIYEDTVNSSHYLRASLSWTSFLSRCWRWEAGAGVSRYHLGTKPRASDDWKLETTAPFLRLGTEYRNGRFGAGLFVNQELVTPEAKFTVNDQTAFTLSGFSIEPSLALYF